MANPQYGVNGTQPTNSDQRMSDFYTRNANTKDAGGAIANVFTNIGDNPFFQGMGAGLGSMLFGSPTMRQYATKSGEQMDYANATLGAGKNAMSRLQQMGMGDNNAYGQMNDWRRQYNEDYINPMMKGVSRNMGHSAMNYSSAGNLLRQRGMMDIGSQLANRVGEERKMQQGSIQTGMQLSQSALGQITGAANNALNQSMFDTKVSNEGGILSGLTGIGGIVGMFK